MAYLACSLWCLGYPESALEYSEQALSMAQDFNHPYTLADVLCYSGCMFNAMRRNAVGLMEASIQLIELSNEVSLSLSGWLGMGLAFIGEAMNLQGNQQEAIQVIHEGIEISRRANIRLYEPVALRALAIAQYEDGQLEEAATTLQGAITAIEQSGDRNWEAEFYRLAAKISLKQDDVDGAEDHLQRALEIARRQRAKSWELRSATDLARLWHHQGKSQEAESLLEGIHDWFTEGLDTPDWKEAAALLADLRQAT
jgi:tetratricopeptide (TPR) repeat protein